ncbi:MAG: CehA/McbA family metallohydrolase [Clostridia bacterium]|nr:CehA/McbA family metallohydrolase [Clostridia bacterium]
MLQQQAFVGEKTMLKGCLHCHTTRSDGPMTPEDTIRYYKERGYDFMAPTDHRIYNYTNYAPETGLIVVPAVEMSTLNIFRNDGNGFGCFHSVCIGPSKEDGNGFLQDEEWPDLPVVNSEEFQPYLDEMHQKNNLTIYCHPEWSGTPARLFETQKGHFAMEIWNSASAMNSDCDKDAAYWDEVLNQGVRLWGVAVDDSHGVKDCCNGWVMVRAEKDLNSILAALKAGAFYSSCGPEIYNFYIKDNKFMIDCSPVAKIRLHSLRQPTKMVYSEKGDLTHAEFPAEWCNNYPHARFTIIDKDGKHAWTNPIFPIYDGPKVIGLQP